MANFFGVSGDKICLAVLVMIFYIIAKSRRIIIPKIRGMQVYFAAIIVMMIYGLTQIEGVDYLKGTYFVITSVLIIVIGYYINYAFKNKSVILTLEICAILMIGYTVLNAVYHVGDIKELKNIRDIFGVGANDILIIVLILMHYCLFHGYVIINKFVDRIVIALGLITVAMSLNRSTTFSAIISIALICILNMMGNRRRGQIFIRAVTILIAGIGLSAIAFTVLPSNTVSEYFEKVDQSGEEINSETEFSNNTSILNNWRGYEIKKAREQWLDYNGLEMIIGGGIQKTIKMEDIPEYMTEEQESMKNNESPLLHNGFYTLLVKGGLLAVIGLIIWFLSPIYYMFRYKNTNKQREVLILMMVLNVVMILLTYVVRGMCGQGAIISYCVCIGALSGQYNEEKDAIGTDIELDEERVI